jgi:hypothetical protein
MTMTDKTLHERIAEDRAHYLAHPDEDEWEEAPAPAPAEASAKRQVGAMISVRLSASETDEIRAAAEAAGLPVSAFVRKIVLDHIRAGWGGNGIVAVTLGTFGRMVTQVDLQPGVPVSGGVPSSGSLVA